MKRAKLAWKLCFGLLMVLAVNLGIRALFDPSAWYGNETLDHKMLEYTQNPEQYNTYHLGSSCIFWNIDPDLFDSLMPPEWGIRSYNFGSGGTLAPETYDFQSHLLRRYSPQPKAIIIELRDISRFPDHHRHTLRKRYWITPYWYLFMVRANLDSHIPAKERRNSNVQYGVALLERTFNIDYFNDIYGQPKAVKDNYQMRLNNLRTRGYRGFLPILAEREWEQNDERLGDPLKLDKMAAEYRAIRSKGDKLMVNRVHLRKILDIIRRCDELDIHLIFLFHPKQDPVHLEEIIALARHIPENHLINLADPDRFPELYLPEYSLNNNHFNIKGTEILTTLAAEHFTEKHRAWQVQARAANNRQ